MACDLKLEEAGGVLVVECRSCHHAAGFGNHGNLEFVLGILHDHPGPDRDLACSQVPGQVDSVDLPTEIY